MLTLRRRPPGGGGSNEQRGFVYLCTDSVDVAIEVLKSAGVLRGEFCVQ